MLIARQPIFDTRTHKIHAYELLARNGSLSVFVPPAPQDHAWAQIDSGVVEMAGQLLKHDSHLFLNVSEQTLLHDRYFLPWLSHIESKLACHTVSIEVTEHVSTRTLDKRWEHLRSLGGMLIMDDFGKQNSTLERICGFDWDAVKFEASQRDYSELQYDAIQTCADRGILTIAECIETHSQASAAKKLGMYLQQGYLWGKPEIVRHAQRHDPRHLGQPATEDGR